jgi:phosphoribosyl 1,2-cyclic phosphate phosphodiesterase
MARERECDIDSVLITHTHADHVMGMDDLRSISGKTGRDVPVYALPEHQDDIRRIFPYAFQEFAPGIQVPRFSMVDIPPVLELCGMTLLCFKVWHGKTTVVAFRTGDFAYITDVSKIPEEHYSLLDGLQTLVLDAVRLRPHPNHLHYDAAVEVAQRIRAKQTFFTHLSHDYDHDEFEKTMPDGIRLAYDGQRITISGHQLES